MAVNIIVSYYVKCMCIIASYQNLVIDLRYLKGHSLNTKTSLLVCILLSFRFVYVLIDNCTKKQYAFLKTLSSDKE